MERQRGRSRPEPDTQPTNEDRRREPSDGAVGNQEFGRAVAPPPEGERVSPPLMDRLVSALGTPVGDMRVRTGKRAEEVAGESRAVTIGDDVFLGREAQDGDATETLVHEAVHVAQQKGGSMDAAPESVGTRERIANQAAARIMRGDFPGDVGSFDGVAALHQDEPAGIEAKVREIITEEQAFMPLSYRVYQLGDLRAIPERLRFDLIDRVLRSPDGFDKMRLLFRLWESFGDAVLTHARERGMLWANSVAAGAQLYDLEALDVLKGRFEFDVKDLATTYLNENQLFVEAEIARLGLFTDPTAHGFTADAPAERMEFIQAQAANLQRAVEARDALLEGAVGYWTPPTTPGVEIFDVLDTFEIVIADFDPNREPPHGPRGNEDPPMRTWKDVKAEWDKANAVIQGISGQSPALHGALHQDRLEQVLSTDRAEARAAVWMTLRQLVGKISETSQMITYNDLDWQDLAPIHAQLLWGERPGRTGTRWDDPFNRRVAGDELSDHEFQQFWIQLGLATLGAAMFVFAPYAGAFGLAMTTVGVGTGMLQAGISWEHYVDLATAETAEARPGTGIVAEGAADAALGAAVLDTVFMFLDVLPPAWKFAKGRRLTRGAAQAGKATAASLLAGIGQRSGMDAANALEAGIAQFGLKGALDHSGLSALQLRRRMSLGRGSEGTHAWRLINEHLDRAAKGKPGLLADAASSSRRQVDPGDSDSLMKAIDEVGAGMAVQRAGGWEKVSAALDPGSPAAERLVGWRAQIARDIEDQFGEGIVRVTGSRGNLKNDLDMSTLGEDAWKNQQRVKAFLAERAGVGVNEVEGVLHAQVFTDPRRMHLYDLLENSEMREQISREVEDFQREMVWAQRLEGAAGNPEMQQAIREQGRLSGVRFDVPYSRINEAQSAALASRMDAIHAMSMRASAAGDQAAMATLARKMAEYETVLKISGGGAYTTSGAVRRFVTEESQLGQRASPTGAVGRPAVDSARQLAEKNFSEFVAQLPYFDTYLRRAEAALKLGDPMELEKALRDISKYGERMAQVAKDHKIILGVDPRVFDELATDLQVIKKRIDDGLSGIETPRMLDDLATRTARNVKALEEASFEYMEAMRSQLALAGTKGGAEHITRAIDLHTRMLLITDDMVRLLNGAAEEWWALMGLAEGSDDGAKIASPAVED